jgi:hypothetical protein
LTAYVARRSYSRRCSRSSAAQSAALGVHLGGGKIASAQCGDLQVDRRGIDAWIIVWQQIERRRGNFCQKLIERWRVGGSGDGTFRNASIDGGEAPVRVKRGQASTGRAPGCRTEDQKRNQVRRPRYDAPGTSTSAFIRTDVSAPCWLIVSQRGRARKHDNLTFSMRVTEYSFFKSWASNVTRSPALTRLSIAGSSA